MRRLWNWLFYKPYGFNGKHFRTEAAMSKAVWRKALEP